MLLYMPKESDLPKGEEDWVGEMMRELNEENVKNQDLKLLMVNTTVEVAREVGVYPHLAPWKIFKNLNYETAKSSLHLITYFHKTIHTFPYDLNDVTMK